MLVMQDILKILGLLLVTGLSGCAYVLPACSRPANVQLKVQASQPERYAIRVTALEPPSDYSVAADGRVTFTVPSFREGCSIYLFEVVKVADARPERIPVVQVLREGRTVRKLSLARIAKLPEDDSGYRIVRTGR